MGASFSVDSCRAAFGQEPNCTLPSPLPIGLDAPFLGDVRKGEFEANPDIAGAGILIGFFGVTWCALICHLLTLVLVQTARIRRHCPSPLMDPLRRFAYACSDQQLLTGLAYTISLRYRTGCSLSAYHHTIAQDTLCVIAITQCVASAFFVTFHRNDLVVNSIRLLGAIPFWALGALFLRVPLDNRYLDQGQSLFVLPALCFTEHSSALPRGSLTDEFGPTTGILATPTFAYVLFWGLLALWVSFVLAGALREARRFLGEEDSGVSISRGFIVFFLLIITMGLAMMIYTTNEMYKFRKRVYASGWMDDSNGNAEEDLSALGQLIPLVLLVLTVYPIVDMVTNKAK